jgi:uncharacterized protein
MVLELETVFNTPGESLAFDFLLEMPQDALLFAECPRVAGWVKNRAGVVTLEGTAEGLLRTQCDRCAEPLDYRTETPFAHTLVTTRASDESDDLVLLESYHYSPDHLVWEDLVLALPQKILCRASCKGLCPRCGKNLNEGPCACKPEGDPRWAALQNFPAESDS